MGEKYSKLETESKKRVTEREIGEREREITRFRGGGRKSIR